jgi:hypothetical protein
LRGGREGGGEERGKMAGKERERGQKCLHKQAVNTQIR